MIPPWVAALIFVVVIGIVGVYEVITLKFFPRYSITALTQRRTHGVLILVAAFAGILGYVLGLGEHLQR